jgi:hypothetical protein
MLCQNSGLGIYVIPAQAGIQTLALDYRLRGNDEPVNNVGQNTTVSSESNLSCESRLGV